MRTAAAVAATPSSNVVLYGDSLSAQAEKYFNFFTGLSGATVVDHVFPGTAPCNWLPQISSDAASGRFQVAVLQFSGNALGCMDYTPETPEYYDAYRQQITQAAQELTAAGAHVFLIGSPMNYGEVENADTLWDHLNEIYAAIASSLPGATFVNAESAVESAGQFAWALPCLQFESYCGPDGQNIVRAADGGHFCPQDPNSVNCAAWESGAIRYGMAMASPVDDFLQSGSVSGSTPAFEGDPLPPAGSAPTMASGQVDPYADLHDALTLVAPLDSGQQMVSIDRRYTATMEPDGNLVVAGPAGTTWATNTAGSGADHLEVGTDGNVSLVGPSGSVWSTNTARTGGNYLALQEDGRLVLYGPDSPLWSSPAIETVSAGIVGMAPTPTGRGYWLAARTGQVFPFGDAVGYGSLAGVRLNAPVIGIAATPDGRGYWLLGADGGVFSFGDARFYGSTGGIRLNRPVIAMGSTPDGHGYWLVASDGGIFAFGDARFFGSTGNVRLNAPVVGMASTGDAGGYYLVASDGGIFAFGDAAFAGSMGNQHLDAPIVAMAVDPVTHGYWEVATDGGVFSFHAPFWGSTGRYGSFAPVIALTATSDGNGYRLLTTEGMVTDFGDAPYAYVPR